jgi:hypothetical protein
VASLDHRYGFDLHKLSFVAEIGHTHKRARRADERRRREDLPNPREVILIARYDVDRRLNDILSRDARPIKNLLGFAITDRVWASRSPRPIRLPFASTGTAPSV